MEPQDITNPTRSRDFFLRALLATMGTEQTVGIPRTGDDHMETGDTAVFKLHSPDVTSPEYLVVDVLATVVQITKRSRLS